MPALMGGAGPVQDDLRGRRTNSAKWKLEDAKTLRGPMRASRVRAHAPQFCQGPHIGQPDFLSVHSNPWLAKRAKIRCRHIVKWADRNPELWHQALGAAAHEAFHRAFPCR